MATIAGKGCSAWEGAVKIGGVESWDGSFEVDELDDTSMGDTAGATIAGLQNASFSISCKRDTADAGQIAIVTAALAGTEIAFKLAEDGTPTHYFSGSARPKVKMAANVKGVVMMTISGKVSNGTAWTYS